MKIIKSILLALFLLIPCNEAFAELKPDGKVQDIQKQVDANKEATQNPVSESWQPDQAGPTDSTIAGEQQGGYVTKEELYEKLHENKQETIELANTEVANLTSYFSALIGFLALFFAIIALFVGWAYKKTNDLIMQATKAKNELDERIKQTEEYQGKLNQILTSKEFDDKMIGIDEKMKEVDKTVKDLIHYQVYNLLTEVTDLFTTIGIRIAILEAKGYLSKEEHLKQQFHNLQLNLNESEKDYKDNRKNYGVAELRKIVANINNIYRNAKELEGTIDVMYHENIITM